MSWDYVRLLRDVGTLKTDMNLSLVEIKSSHKKANNEKCDILRIGFTLGNINKYSVCSIYNTN